MKRLALVLFSLFLTTSVLAAYIQLDLGYSSSDTQSTHPVPPGWNSIDSNNVISSPIIDSTGANIGVGESDFGINISMSVTGSLGRSTLASGFSDTTWAEDAVKDFIYLYDTTAIITLSGLSAGKDYKVEIVASRDDSRIGTFATVNGESADHSNSDITDESTLENWVYSEDDWLVWDGVSIGEGDDLTISVTKSVAVGVDYGVINAIRISEAPEPATIALFGIGGVLLRKRKKM